MAAQTGDKYLEVLGKKMEPTVSKQVRDEYLTRLEETAADVALRYVDINAHLDTDIFADSTNLANLTKLESAAALQVSSKIPLLLSAERLTFEIKTGEISTSIITMHNKGTTAIYFQCKQRLNANKTLPTKYVDSRRQKFLFYYKNGVILPGHAFDIPITFTSSTPGVSLIV